MRCFAGSCRFVYNKGLALQKARFDAGEKKIGYAGLCKLLTEWRSNAETSWLKDAPTHPLQQALKDLERAYTNFFAKRADGARPACPWPDRRRPSRLPAQDLNHDQPKPRDGVCRGPAGAQHVQVGSRFNPNARQACSGQVRSEQSHPRSGLVRVPPPIGLQAVMERRLSHPRAATEHQ
jgi:hypothetical protein